MGIRGANGASYRHHLVLAAMFWTRSSSCRAVVLTLFSFPLFSQCARRGLSCVYPTENRRGTRARQPQRRSPQPRGKKHNAAPPAPGVDGMQIYDPESMWPSGDDDEDDDAHYAEPSSSSGIATSA